MIDSIKPLLESKRRVKLITASLILLLIFILGFVIWQIRNPELDYQSGNPGPVVQITIPPGSSGAQIGRILTKAGVVKTSVIFFRVATGDERANRVSAGTYLIDTHISAKEAITQLLDKKRLQGRFLIIEGARSAEISENLESKGFIKKDISIALSALKLPAKFNTTAVEGMLYPANYTILPNEEVSQLLQTVIARFEQELNSLDFYTAAKDLNLTPFELLIIASIVQAEGFNESDFRKIATVIYNRLKIGMALQMDSTLLYANKSRGEIRVTKTQLLSISKYNTYKYRGLPPGPIGSPGSAALKAVLNPIPGKWLYFVTVKPGSTNFTDNYPEFLELKAEFLRNYQAGAFRGSQ